MRDADEHEAEITRGWLRARAALGSVVLSFGVAAPVIVLTGLWLAPDAVFELRKMAARIAAGSVVCLAAGLYVLRVGWPGERSRSDGPVPWSTVLRMGAPILCATTILLAWPLGLYGALWDASRMRGNPCVEILPPEEVEAVAHLRYRIAAVEHDEARCVVEVTPLPGRRSAAALRVEMTSRRGARELDRELRQYGGPGEPVPALGPDARRVRRRGGQILGFLLEGSVVVVQLPADHWSDAEVDEVVTSIARRLAP